jgi:hypothetical protein
LGEKRAAGMNALVPVLPGQASAKRADYMPFNKKIKQKYLTLGLYCLTSSSPTPCDSPITFLSFFS